jgi:predicted regulator of Ras-like GTPase activity (Roadblock/LC7/MglB family)
MNDDVTAAVGGHGLNWLLDDLVRRLAGAENAIVLSSDGLALGRSTALDRDSAEHLAAMASAFQSLSRGVGSTFSKGAVRQTVVELEYGYLMVTEAGAGACLALLASGHADLGMMAYEMNVIVQQVGGSLSASPRAMPPESSARRSP